MPVVYFSSGRRVTVDPSQAKGKGGEADIYLLDSKTVLKLYKQPNHPDFDNPADREAARRRIAVHQTKLRDFPRNLPDHVITPDELVFDQHGKITGCTMRFVNGGEVLFSYSQLGSALRQAVDNNVVTAMFQDLYRSVLGVHAAGVVIGDFNDLNELVVGHRDVFLIDADSWQWGNYSCTVYTARFVDPLIIRPATDQERKSDPGLGHYVMCKPHNSESDWYAFNVMLFCCLLGTDPYGGIFRPVNKSRLVPHPARLLHRITVFNKEVMYPKKNSIHFSRLPDDFLQYFQLVLEKDKREAFPEQFLIGLRWTRCSVCGTEHARAVCPECAQVAPAAVVQHVVKRGKVTATRIFTTRGVILFATVQNGQLKWIYHEDGKLRRDQDQAIAPIQLTQVADMRFRIKGDSTLLGRGNRLMTILQDGRSEMTEVDTFGNLPVFDANSEYTYWISSNGQLVRDGQFGSEFVGDVLSGQTLFWVGPKFGFGFYRAGEICVSFVFDAEARGINDTVRVPRWRWQLVDSTATFSSERCWFFVTLKEGSRTVNRCFIINQSGLVEAQAEAEAGDTSSWLGTIKGKTATGTILYAATDDGVVAMGTEGGKIVTKSEFPDTEPFVGSGDNLFISRDGLYVVGRQSITRLVMA